MNRKDFIINSCTACLSATALAGLLSSCKSTQYISGKLNDDGILVDTDDFKITKKGKTTYHSFIIVRNEALQYPVCVYRFNDNEYSALWMQCSHQGAELQASGDFLQCTAHGSEFSNKGKVTNGPADKDLKSFPVLVNNNQLFIDLRKK
jgi:nitrite reductase/ring-hydroxylating ferredoxin subunit